MPISTASQIIALKSPDLSSDPRLSDFVDLAVLQTSKDAFGTKYQLAIALLVLHWLTLESQGGGSSSGSGSGVIGGIKSEKEGDLSRSYGSLINPSGKGSDNYFNSTVFGAELLTLRRSCIMMPRNRCI